MYIITLYCDDFFTLYIGAGEPAGDGEALPVGVPTPDTKILLKKKMQIRNLLWLVVVATVKHFHFVTQVGLLDVVALPWVLLMEKYLLLYFSAQWKQQAGISQESLLG